MYSQWASGVVTYLPIPELRPIGNYSFSLGTIEDNKWKDAYKRGGVNERTISAHGFQIALGGQGDDHLGALTLESADKSYRKMAILSGGLGNDRYLLGLNSSVIICDAPGDKYSGYGYDIIDVPLSLNDLSLLKIDGRDIFATDGKDFAVLLIDPTGIYKGQNKIERIDLVDHKIYQSDLSKLISSSTVPDYTYQYLSSIGLFLPEKAGIDIENITGYIDDLMHNNSLVSRAFHSSSTSDNAARYIHESAISSYHYGDQYDIDLSGKNWVYYATASTHNARLKPMRVVQAGEGNDQLEAPQIDFSLKLAEDAFQGSIIDGGAGNDRIQCKAGWDIVGGGDGDDFIRAGNGRDIITGGRGNDELWGDFGWNTYTSERDGYTDKIVIKSDEYLVNWLNGKAGNNPNGEKCDIIEGLDPFDQIVIYGINPEQLSFAVATAKNAYGIGIFAGSALEALYTGNDLTLDQIRSMTSTAMY